MLWVYILLVITLGVAIAALVISLTQSVSDEIRNNPATQNEINSLVRTNTSVLANTAKTPNYIYCTGAEAGSIDLTQQVNKYPDGTRVLLYGQQNPVENGVYEVLTSQYVRGSDLSSDSQVYPGALVYAGGNLFVLNSSGPFSNTAVVTASLSFTQIV